MVVMCMIMLVHLPNILKNGAEIIGTSMTYVLMYVSPIRPGLLCKQVCVSYINNNLSKCKYIPVLIKPTGVVYLL